MSPPSTGSVGVLHVIAPAPFGGAETALLALCRGLQEQIRPSVAILADARSGPFIKQVESAGLPHTVVDSPSRNYLRDIRALRTLVRRDRITLLHSHGYRADAVGLIAARLESVPNVATAHGFTGGSLRNRINQFIGVQALRHSSAVIAVSAPLGTTLQGEGVRRERLHVIPNAWAPPAGQPMTRAAARARLGLPADGRIVGWVGRMSAEKGPDLAIDALAGLERDVSLCMIGDGPGRALAEGRAMELGVMPMVRLAGSISGVWEVLPAFDVLLLSSRTEGTPMILLEAMHAEVPIVASSVGGVPALLDEETARLAPASGPALGDALRAALADPDESRRRAAAARRRLAERNDMTQWIDRHLALYSSLSGVRAA